MPVMLTVVARVKDWRRLQGLNEQAWVDRAAAAGAARWHIYRNAHDAGQMLLVAEFPDHEALQDFSLAITNALRPMLAGGALEDGCWESTGWRTIGEAASG
jgi:hypothetical protein